MDILCNIADVKMLNSKYTLITPLAFDAFCDITVIGQLYDVSRWILV